MPRLRARAAPNPPPSAPTASSTRPRRGTAGRNDAPATIQRSSPEETRQSLSLTVKSSPNKLRQATGAPAVSKGNLSRTNIVSGKRASRNSRIVREVDSEEDDEEDDPEDEADEVDAMDVDDDEEEEDDVDAEGSEEDDDMDAEGDEEDDEPIVVPTSKPIPVASKPKISVTKAQDAVEAKEMAMSDDDDDDELSDPDSDLDDMEDAEGEDDDAEGEEDDELAGGPEEGDMDMESDDDMSRDQTPDVTKMTRRQRAVLEQEEDGSLLALSNEAQKKKHLTAEEHAMRRAEMARRRKNLSEKRNEEEKVRLIPSHLIPSSPQSLSLSLSHTRHASCAPPPILTPPPSSTQSTASSKSSPPSAAARAPPPPTWTSPVRRQSPSPSAQIHASRATSRAQRAPCWLSPTSGCRRPLGRFSQARRSSRVGRRGGGRWSRRLHKRLCERSRREWLWLLTGSFWATPLWTISFQALRETRVVSGKQNAK